MSGTNAYLAKRYLLDMLRGALRGPQVEYSYPGRNPEREIVFGGKTSWEHTRIGMTQGLAQREQREETLRVTLHIEVAQPGATIADTEQRATEIGAEIEEAVAGNSTLGGLVLQAVCTAGAMDSGNDDESAITGVTYEVTAKAHLL